MDKTRNRRLSAARFAKGTERSATTPTAAVPTASATKFAISTEATPPAPVSAGEKKARLIQPQ